MCGDMHLHRPPFGPQAACRETSAETPRRRCREMSPTVALNRGSQRLSGCESRCWSGGPKRASSSLLETAAAKYLWTVLRGALCGMQQLFEPEQHLGCDHRNIFWNSGVVGRRYVAHIRRRQVRDIQREDHVDASSLVRPIDGNLLWRFLSETWSRVAV